MMGIDRTVSFPPHLFNRFTPEITARIDASPFDRLDTPQRTNLYLGSAFAASFAAPPAAQPWPLPGSSTTPVGNVPQTPGNTLKGQDRTQIYTTVLMAADAAAALHAQSNCIVACLAGAAAVGLVFACTTYAVPMGVILAVSLAAAGALAYAAIAAMVVARQTRTIDALAQLAASFETMGANSAAVDAALLIELTSRRRYFGIVPSELNQPISEYVERFNEVHGAAA